MYITIALSVLFSISIHFLIVSRSKLNELEAQNMDIQKTYEPASLEEKKLSKLSNEYSTLQSSYQEKLATLRKSEKRLSQYYLGVGTTDSVSYKSLTKEESIDAVEARLLDIKTSLKHLVSEKKACICSMGKDVVVNGKKSEAKKLFNREIKLRLRCLDNEFKAALAIIDWNNVNRIIQRTKDTFSEINTTGSIVKTYLKDQYLNLKIEELRLTYELNQIKQEIKEAEREEAQIVREAEREGKRIKAAAEKAEKDRKLMEKLVAEELSKLESSSKEQKALYELHKQQLHDLREKEKRAVSLAQTTRAGYVYIISNETSFGEGVVKIGMTRRADPNDRVKELGDASVPELFDVHAFVFTEDAPVLEKFLHNEFSGQRVNLVNGRKEFFYTKPNDVLSKLKEYGQNIEINEFEVEVKKVPIVQSKHELEITKEDGIQGAFDIAGNSSSTVKLNKLTEQVQKNNSFEQKDKQQKKQEQLKEKLLKRKNKSKNPIKPSPIFNDSYTPKKQIGKNSSFKTNDTIKLFSASEYPNDKEMQQHAYEEQIEAKMYMDKAKNSELVAFAMKEHPEDYSMQQHVYEEQVEAKEFMDKAKNTELAAFAIKEHPEDYSMQQFVYEEQVEAKEFMDKAKNAELAAFAIKENPEDYSMQQFVYEEQIEAKEFMDKAKNAELAAFAIKEHPEDYSMQQYVYEEKLES